MKEVFEQYGGAIITVMAVAALAAMIALIIGNDDKSPVFLAFQNLMTQFGNKVK